MILSKFKLRYLACLLTPFLLAYAGFKIYQYKESLPKKVDSYQSMALGETKDSLEAALGAPTHVLFPPEKKNAILEKNSNILVVEVSKIALKKEIDANPQKEKGFDDWEYQKPGYSVFVKFDSATDKINLISCYIFDFSKIDPQACSVNKIRVGDTEDQVRNILGEPSSVDHDGPTKILSYAKLNMLVFLDKDGVFNIQIKSFS